jgi:HNH endonuclease
LNKQRFLQHVDIQRNGCWHWTAARRGSPYGQAKHEGRVWYAHRLAYALFKGDIAPGLKVLHGCDNPICVNPEHLELGTQSDNIQQCAARGHLVDNTGEKHGMARLTAYRVLQIRESSRGNREEAVIHDVSEATIRAIRKRKLWKHL